MNDNAASTSRARFIVRRIIEAIAILSITGFLGFVLLRMYATYVTQQHIHELQQEVHVLNERMQVMDRDHAARLDALEQTLFADVQPKVDRQETDKQRPATRAVEPWQINRDRELRERIRELQYRVWELERDR